MSDDESRTIFVGNLSPDVTEDILYELCLQAGPLDSVKIPSDKATGRKSFGFVCFKDECSVPYAVYLLNNTNIYGRNIKVQTRRKATILPPMEQVGIHSLDPEYSSSVDQNMVSNMADSIQSGYPGQVPVPQNNFNTPPLMPGIPPLFSNFPPMPANLLCNYPGNYVTYNNGYQSFGAGVPSIDTQNMNNFKMSQENFHQRYNDNRHGNFNRDEGNNYSPNNSYKRSDHRRHNSYNSYSDHRYSDHSSHNNRRQDSHYRNGDYNQRNHHRSESYHDQRSSSHNSSDGQHRRR